MKSCIDVLVYKDGAQPSLDTVANEIPVAFQYNGISYAVMLCSPSDLDCLGVGFSLSEGLIDNPTQIFDIKISQSIDGFTIAMEIAAGSFMNLKARKRAMAGRTGCGICGVESLTSVKRDIPYLTHQSRFPVSAFQFANQALLEHQTLQKITGATHAACHINDHGEISHVKEDIGRHNALDKCLGSLARHTKNRDGAIFVTSRASFEMVQKTASLGYATLAAISAPTAAAITLADQLGITLIGFVRGNHFVVYTHPESLEGLNSQV
jgi:FdhD protein